jgi:hypothetical protein
MSTSTAKRILAQAESRMAVQADNGIPQAERDEITRVVDFMATHDFQEAPPDADPELVALIRRLDDSV